MSGTVVSPWQLIVSSLFDPLVPGLFCTVANHRNSYFHRQIGEVTCFTLNLVNNSFNLITVGRSFSFLQMLPSVSTGLKVASLISFLWMSWLFLKQS